jgi:hypothetical protein
MGSEVCLWYILWGRAAVAVATLLERLRNDRGERPLASYGESTPEFRRKKEPPRSMRGLGKMTERGERGERLVLEASDLGPSVGLVDVAVAVAVAVAAADCAPAPVAGLAWSRSNSLTLKMSSESGARMPSVA